MRIAELKKEEYNPFYQTYIDVLGDVELFDLLRRQLENFPQFLGSLPDEKLHYAYAEGKWTIAEALLHVLDTERVFQYRALRFMRGDKTPLPGFDQNLYVPNSNADRRTKDSIIEEYKTIRLSTIALFSNMNGQMLHNMGKASNSPMSVAALGFIICGHQKHHRNVIRERYLDGKIY
ncbi:MAG: DinB family protein [Maribacter sp.]|nr:DinB family protein [Maribacter sp.]